MTTISQKELEALVISFKEALKFWIDNLDTELPVSNVDKPLVELGKLADLINSYTTQVGIIFKPSTLVKQFQTAYNTLQKLNETLLLFVSVIGQLKKVGLSSNFYDTIRSKAVAILQYNDSLALELGIIVNNINGPIEHLNGRLSQRLDLVAKILNCCDELKKVLKDGEVNLLKLDFQATLLLIDDGLEDFEEWSQDPEEIDDPFDELSSFNDDDKVSLDETLKHELIEFSTLLNTKIKLIKKLITSSIKSLPLLVPGSDIDGIYHSQKKLATFIDKIILELMMNQNIQLATHLLNDLTYVCKQLTSMIRIINKSNPSKYQWCTTWETQFGIV